MAGIATFANLSIDEPGDGYTLVATAGLGSVESSAFNIAGLVEQCVPGEDCVGTLSEDDTGATVNALADESAPVLTMSLTPGGIDCDGYTEQSATLTFNVTSSREKEVTMTFDTGFGDYEYSLYPDDFQVCFESDTAFTDREGDTVFLGLLPDCTVDEYPSFTIESSSSENDPPCVVDRWNDGSIVSVQFRTPAGDPKGRV